MLMRDSLPILLAYLTLRLAIARLVDYFHIKDRASIPEHSRTIFYVYISSHGFQHSDSTLCWFHYSVEVLVTVRSNIYYLSH